MHRTEAGEMHSIFNIQGQRVVEAFNLFWSPWSQQKRKAEDEGATDQALKQAKSDVVGVASIMSNTKFEEPLIQQEETKSEVTPVPEENPVQPPSSLSKNKKKKKGKKK